MLVADRGRAGGAGRRARGGGGAPRARIALEAATSKTPAPACCSRGGGGGDSRRTVATDGARRARTTAGRRPRRRRWRHRHRPGPAPSTSPATRGRAGGDGGGDLGGARHRAIAGGRKPRGSGDQFMFRGVQPLAGLRNRLGRSNTSKCSGVFREAVSMVNAEIATARSATVRTIVGLGSAPCPWRDRRR